MEKIDLTGHTFGRLIVLEESTPERGNGQWRRFWLCRCECGTKKTIAQYSLTKGKTTSCGCFHRERTGDTHRTHGFRNSSTYHIWSAMKARCTRKTDPAFQRYGGRGIFVCENWMSSFESFLNDMGERPEGLSLERIDNSGPYCKGNCIWATNRQQSRNRRSCHMVTIGDISATLTEWCEKLGINYQTVLSRLNYGWSHFDALTRPVATRERMVA